MRYGSKQQLWVVVFVLPYGERILGPYHSQAAATRIANRLTNRAKGKTAHTQPLFTFSDARQRYQTEGISNTI